LLVLNTFFLSSTNQVSTTQVFYNSHTTTAKTIPVEMAQSLKGFWSFTELGSKTDLSGKKQTAYWPHSSSFWPSFSPGFVQGVSPLALSGSAWIQVNLICSLGGGSNIEQYVSIKDIKCLQGIAGYSQGGVDLHWKTTSSGRIP
jgi:hypothetical protein